VLFRDDAFYTYWDGELAFEEELNKGTERERS
jgi:hypothetical protein